MSLTRAEILTAAQTDSRVGTTIDTTQANDWFNDFNEMTWEAKSSVSPLKNASTQDYSITQDRQSLTLPADFRDMAKRGLGLFIVNDNIDSKDRPRPIPETSESAGYGYYWTSETTLTVVGYVGYTLRLFYLSDLTRASVYAGTDELLIENRFKEYAVSYIRYRYFLDKNLREFMADEMAYLEDREAEFEKGLRKNSRSLRIPLMTDVITY